MSRYKLIIKFISPLRGTRPATNLTKAHLESVRGRLIPFLRSQKPKLTEKKLEEEFQKWVHQTLTVFPRKRYNGIEQVAIPSTWIYGFLKNRVSAVKIRGINRKVIEQDIFIRPRLIGLRRGGKPITDVDEIVEDTIVSSDKFGKRAAIKHFEVINPPAYTETIYVDSDLPRETLEKLFERGRMGASRGLGYGSCIGLLRG